MDGILVIDKPQGPTSHDVVSLARRALRESRIGHTGTLDPLATGVLPLAIGRATRLVRFLTASDKDYLATIRFGATTDSYDAAGEETSRTGRQPDAARLAAGVAALRGAYDQTPPPFSAKKVDGRRAYEMARRHEPVELKPVPVRVARADVLDFDGWSARVSLTCSAGFYVRSFAHALGEAVGTGAYLEALQRTRSGEFRLDEAMTVDGLRAGREEVADWLIPLERLLTSFPAVRVSEEGRLWIGHGREIGVDQYETSPPKAQDSRPGSLEAESPDVPAAWVRLLDADGHLLGLAAPGSRPGTLHPSIVLT